MLTSCPKCSHNHSVKDGIVKNRQTDIHVQTKAETFTVEGYNSLFRHFLARMRRESKCYTKSIKCLNIQ